MLEHNSSDAIAPKTKLKTVIKEMSGKRKQQPEIDCLAHLRIREIEVNNI